MFADLIAHHKDRLPFYKRAAKKKYFDASIVVISKAGRIKNEYIEAWKTHPEEMLKLTIAGAITGTSLGLAYVYRRQAKQYDKGFWVEICREWVDEMDSGKFLVMKIDGDSLLAKTMNQDGTP